MISPKPFLLSAAVLLGTAAIAGAHPKAPPAFTLKVFAGAPNKATSGPDDITGLDGHVFVAWQNGIGPKGEAAPRSGATSSLLVEYSARGRRVATWSLKGKIDGIAGDPGLHAVIASVNEDGNTSLYTVKPAKAKAIQHYAFSPSPDSVGKGALTTGGGTDAVVIAAGKILISASAPIHTNRTAAFRVTLNARRGIATLHPTFADNARATDEFTGNRVKLSLTDPDSNAVVPMSSSLFGGDFMLDGQGDQQLVFVSGIGSGHVSLTRVALSYGNNNKSAGVDDVRWVQRAGQTLYVVDAGANKVYAIKGPFTRGEAVASMDSVGKSSMGTQVATLNAGSGELTPLITGLKAAKGLLFQK